MDNFATASAFSDNTRGGVIVVWLLVVLFVITGFNWVKEIIANVLMTLYEFFIQKNAVKL